jgi:anaerobic selenocysteine-containing dehydrogenase
VIDPRRTATCNIADLHLPLRPGSDVAVFAGLLRYLVEHGACNDAWTTRYTNGCSAALAHAPRPIKPQQSLMLPLPTSAIFITGSPPPSGLSRSIRKGYPQARLGVKHITQYAEQGARLYCRGPNAIADEFSNRLRLTRDRGD